MKIDELKKQVQEMQNSAQQTSNELHNAECNVDDIESYTSGCRDSIEDCKVSVNNLDDELEDMKVHLDNLEGFDMETVRKEVKEEMISELTNKFSRFLEESMFPSLPTDELKKAPAKKSTETDNQ
jgi:predicted  nucleic acid-binding Zn-ribbon protein